MFPLQGFGGTELVLQLHLQPQDGGKEFPTVTAVQCSVGYCGLDLQVIDLLHEQCTIHHAGLMYKLCNENLRFDAGYDFKFCSSFFMFGHLFLISEIHEHVQGDALSGLASHDASPRTGPHAERDV